MRSLLCGKHGLHRLKSKTFNSTARVFSLSILAGKANVKLLTESEKIEAALKKTEYDREYNLKNKARRNQKSREYKAKNKERLAEHERKVRATESYKEKKSIYGRKYRATEKYKEKMAIKTSNPQQREKKNLQARERYRVNQPRILKGRREAYAKNPEKRRKFARDFYAIKKDSIIEKRTQRKKKTNENYIRRKIIYDWKDQSSVKSFFENAKKLLNIKDDAFWYQVSKLQIKKVGGGGMFRNYASLGFALQFAYPETEWDMAAFSLRNKGSSQRWITSLVLNLLENKYSVKVEYQGNPLLRYEGSHRNFRLDIFIEELNLAIEYQGRQHYEEIPSPNYLINRRTSINSPRSAQISTIRSLSKTSADSTHIL